MNKRRQLRVAKEIAVIRGLQRERSLGEAQRLASRLRQTLDAEESAQEALNAQTDALRNVLTEAESGLSIELAANVHGAIASGRMSLASARAAVAFAAQQSDQHRAELAQSQRLHEAAETLADRTARAYRQSCDARQSEIIEDSFRAREKAR